MKKGLLLLTFFALFLTACGDSKEKSMVDEKNAADTIQLLEEKKLDGAEEYCFEFPKESVSWFSDTVFIQHIGDLNRYMRIAQGEITELKAKEATLKDTVQFTNPYTNRVESLLLEIQGFMLDGNFYMTENGNSGKYVEYGDGTREWVEITVRQAYRKNLVWLYVCPREADITDTEYLLLYDLNKKKAEDVFRTCLPEDFLVSQTLLSSDGKSAILKAGQAGERGTFYYVNAISGETVLVNELVDKPLDSVAFTNERTLTLTLEQEKGKTAKYYYDLLDKMLYEETEKIVSKTSEVENSTAYVQIENGIYTLHTLEKSIQLKELDGEKEYCFQANPSGNKIAVTEKIASGMCIEVIGVLDLESESYVIYPQKFAYGKQRELFWAGDNCFVISVWGGYYYFYEF